MRKCIKVGLCLILVLGSIFCLCACGSEAPAEKDVQIEAQPKVEETLAVEETIAAVEETEAQEETAANPAADKKALAESCIDKDVSELYALIGEPESADYAPSCLNPGVGEDGNLYYDGFIVYTYREGDTETVQYVEEAE